MQKQLRQQWFLLALVAMLVLGMSGSRWLLPVSEPVWLRSGIVVVVLFLMALPLQTATLWQTICRPWPALWASVVNLALLPLIAWPFSRVFAGDLAAGLMVTAATPCTLAGASVWTRRAGGNDAVAMMVTVITNLSCFLVTPVWLFITVGQGHDFSAARMSQMIVRLGTLVVVPIVLAQLLRQHPPIGGWAKEEKAKLGIVAQFGILLMVLIGAIKTGATLAAVDGFLGEIFPLLLMGVAVAAIHLVAMLCGIGGGRLFKFEPDDNTAIAFASSQKTLMVGLDVAISFGGMAILPMVMYHACQLLIDTLVADRWRRQKDAAEKAAKEAAKEPAG